MIPKFRAWDKRFSEFVEDFFVSEDGKIYKKTKDTSYGFAISRETSDKIILMQSTGLFDKNGREIFEGDIIKRYRSPFFKAKWEYQIETVIKEEASLLLGREYGKNFGTIPFNSPFAKSDLLEVIGNIYENPELLEEEK